MWWVHITLVTLALWTFAAQARSITKRQLEPTNELTPAKLNALSPIFRRAGPLPFPAAEYYQRQYPVVPPNYYPVNPDGSIYNPNRFPSADNPFFVDNPPVYNYSRNLGDGVIGPSISPKIITILQGLKPRAIRRVVFTRTKRSVCMSDEAIRTFKTTPANLIAFAINNQLIKEDGSIDLDRLAELDVDAAAFDEDAGLSNVQIARPISELQQPSPFIAEAPPQANALPQPPNTAQLYAPYRGQSQAPLFFPGKRRRKRRAPCQGKVGDIDSLDTDTWPQDTGAASGPIQFRGKRHAGHGWDDKTHAHTIEGTREIDPRTGQPITAQSLALQQYQYQYFQRLMAQRQQFLSNPLLGAGGIGAQPPLPVFNAQQQSTISRFYDPNTNPYAKFRQSGINPAVFPYQFQFPSDNTPKPTPAPLLVPLEDIPEPIQAIPLARATSASQSLSKRLRRQIGSSTNVATPIGNIGSTRQLTGIPFLGGGSTNPLALGNIGSTRGVSTPFGGVSSTRSIGLPTITGTGLGNPVSAVAPQQFTPQTAMFPQSQPQQFQPAPVAPVTDPNSDLDDRQRGHLESSGVARPQVINAIPFGGAASPQQPVFSQPQLPNVPVENCLSEVYYVGPSSQYPQGTLLDICGRPVAAELLLGPGQRVNYWPDNPGNALAFTDPPSNVATRSPDPFNQFPLVTDPPTPKPKTKKPKKPKKPKNKNKSNKDLVTDAPEFEEVTDSFGDFDDDLPYTGDILVGDGGVGGDGASITPDELAALLQGK